MSDSTLIVLGLLTIAWVWNTKGAVVERIKDYPGRYPRDRYTRVMGGPSGFRATPATIRVMGGPGGIMPAAPTLTRTQLIETGLKTRRIFDIPSPAAPSTAKFTGVSAKRISRRPAVATPIQKADPSRDRWSQQTSQPAGGVGGENQE